jgi:hypothetical protein
MRRASWRVRLFGEAAELRRFHSPRRQLEETLGWGLSRHGRQPTSRSCGYGGACACWLRKMEQGSLVGHWQSNME